MAKTSDLASMGAPVACSGDMYATFPLRIPTSVSVELSAALAMPKSTTLVVPSYVTNRL